MLSTILSPLHVVICLYLQVYEDTPSLPTLQHFYFSSLLFFCFSVYFSLSNIPSHILVRFIVYWSPLTGM